MCPPRRDSRLPAQNRYLLSGRYLLPIHRRATGRALEPLLFGVLAGNHGRAFPTRGTERIDLGSAGLAQSEAAGCCIGDDEGAIEADDPTAFALGVIAEGAQVLVANHAGSD